MNLKNLSDKLQLIPPSNDITQKAITSFSLARKQKIAHTALEELEDHDDSDDSTIEEDGGNTSQDLFINVSLPEANHGGGGCSRDSLLDKLTISCHKVNRPQKIVYQCAGTSCSVSYSKCQGKRIHRHAAQCHYLPEDLKAVVHNELVAGAKTMDKRRRPRVEGSLEGPHARHEGIEGDEANSWRSPAPSWYPRRRTRPPPVRFSVFRLVSAPLPIGAPIP